MSGNAYGRVIAAILLAACFALAPSVSVSQDAVDGEGLPASAGGDEELLFQDISSVYTASRYAQKVSEAPSSVSIVTASDIRALGYRTLAEVLNGVRGFYVTDDRNYSYLGVRGFGRPGDYNTRILLLVDGHRINNNVYDQALIGREFPLDIDLIERIEVVRGPSSSLYGSSAFFAVVNVLTRGGRDLKGFEAAASAGSYRSFQGRASFGTRFEGGQEAILSASVFDSAGQNLYFREFDDPATFDGIAHRADYERSRNFFGKAQVGDFTIEAVHGSRRKGIPTGAYGTEFGNNGTFTVDEHSYLDLKYERTLPAGVGVMARAFGDSFEYFGDYLYPGPLVNRDSAKGLWWGAELKATKKLFDRHQLTVGGEFRRNHRQAQETFDVDPFNPILDVANHSNVWALYAQDDWRILPSLILNAGVRYDRYSTFGGTTNPRMALIWSPLEATTVKALYGRAFRAPNAYELYYDDSVAIRSNPSLKPETIQTYELVLEQAIGQAFRATASAFQYRVENLITQTIDPLDGMAVFRNMDEVKSRGIELEIEGKGADGLTGRVGYTWQQSEVGPTGDPLSNSPKHLVKAAAIVPLFSERLTVSPELRYTSRRKTDAASLVPVAGSHAVANLTVLARKWVKGLELSASVYNLFDRAYGDPWGEPGRELVEQNGRNYRAKLTYAF